MLNVNRVLRRCFCSTAVSRPWLFVGLGNPGDKYKGTRHNVGFEMVDAFAESQGISMNMAHCKAIFGQGFIGDTPLLLAKPQTYMNLSGESAGPLAAYYKLPLNRVIVFHDDMGLPSGVLRLQNNRGHGGHNGGNEKARRKETKWMCVSPKYNDLVLYRALHIAVSLCLTASTFSSLSTQHTSRF